jgi:hypothetical protein
MDGLNKDAFGRFWEERPPHNRKRRSALESLLEDRSLACVVTIKVFD